MHTVYLPHVQALPDWRERDWITRVLAEHHVREDVVRLLMRRCTFVVEDWQHTDGGRAHDGDERAMNDELLSGV